MATTYSIKDAFLGIVGCLRDSPTLAPFLSGVWTYYAYQEATVDPGKAALYVEAEGSSNDLWVGGPSGAGTLETIFLITLDTILQADSDTVDAESGATSSLMDLEHLVIGALGEKPNLGATNRALVWQVESIQRDTPVPDTEGGIDLDTPIRRTEIRLRVKTPILMATT
jgi:hypothetical protein